MSTTYDSSRVLLQIGLIPIKGFGDNKIVISRTNDVSSVVEGSDGEIIFAKSNKSSGTLSFDLLYGTEYDRFMEAAAFVSYQVPVSFQCLNTGKALTTWGMVATQPDISLGETPESRTWVMNIASVDMFLGGAPSIFTASPQPTTSLI